jgi:predicted ATP-dependent endonuclease of OLD family
MFMDRSDATLKLMKALRHIRDKNPKTWDKIVTPELMDAWDAAKRSLWHFDNDSDLVDLLRILAKLSKTATKEHIMLPMGIVDRIHDKTGEHEDFVPIPLSEVLQYVADMYE